MADSNFSLRPGRMMMACIVSGSVAMVAVIWWYYSSQQKAIKTATAREVAAIAETKVGQIANWRRERLGDGRVLMSSATMRIAKRFLAASDPRPSDRTDIVNVMRGLEREFLYAGAALVDRDGNVRIQSPSEHALSSRILETARAAAREDDVSLTDLYVDSEVGRPMMALTVPVEDLGALILQIDPARFLYPYVTSWPGLSATAESFLIRREGTDGNEVVFLNELRHRRGTALVFRRSLKGKPLATDRYFEDGPAIWGSDYRGVPTVGVIRRVPNSPWYLVAKIDTAEVDAPVRRLGWELALIATLIGIGNVTGVGFIWRDQQVRMHHQREAWFRAMANETPAYLWMASAGDENSFINTPFRKFLGAGQELLSKTWTEYLHPDDADEAVAAFAECFGSRRDYVGEFRIRRFDGEYRWVTSQAAPRFSPDGELLGYAGSVFDITDRRQAERQWKAANAALTVALQERTRRETEIRLLTSRLMNAQEEERRRLARDLHDDLIQQIAGVSIAIGNLKRQIPIQETEARNQSDAVQEKTVELAETVRRISHELHPVVLQHSGIVSALKAYCDEFGELNGIDVSLRTEGSFERVSSAVALGLYRITQESLYNVAKHAQTREAQVALRYSEAVLCLTIKDRGVGMELDRANAPVGLGLVSIRERARLLGGTVEIASEPNQGTSITIRISMPASAFAAPA